MAASIDEFYCDLTGLDRFHDPWALATGLRARIQAETGLPISMGMANSKTLAKIATGMAKPNGELWVQPGTERAWLAQLSIGEIPGAGKQTLAVLSRLGLQTIGQLQTADPTLLTQHLGKMGLVLWHKAQGRPGGPLQTDRVRKSLGHERTFMDDVADHKRLHRSLTRLVEKSGHELRMKGLWASCVTLKLKYADFSQHTHQQTMPPTQTDEALLQVARQLLRQHYAGRKPLRLIGVRFSGLTTTGGQQSLFNQPQKPKLYTALDAIKAKYGERSLKRASGMEPEKGP
jgi:DNA polymerase-4